VGKYGFVLDAVEVIVVVVVLTAVMVLVDAEVHWVVVVDTVVLVGEQEHAELYREGFVPQGAPRLEGNPVVAVLVVVRNVAQNDRPGARLLLGNRARRQLFSELAQEA